jgi:hypothetical protein
VTWQVEDFLLEYLRDAAEELRKRSRGKIGEIRALGIAVESPAWPEEVRLARVELKRRRGRQPGWRSDAQERFFADPNRVAAAIAACLIADFYEEWGRPKSEAASTAQGHGRRSEEVPACFGRRARRRARQRAICSFVAATSQGHSGNRGRAPATGQNGLAGRRADLKW